MLKELPDLKGLTHEQKDALILLLWEEVQILRKENTELRALLEKQAVEIQAQRAEIQALTAKIQTLEARLNKNSQNSSKPPSSDGFRKPDPKSQRGKSNLRTGGQVGHVGSTLEKTETPDFIVVHAVEVCARCGASLADVKPDSHECRQEVDILPIEPQVTEHRAEVKICPACGFENRGAFPDEVDKPIQYGPRIKSTAIYLNQYQFLPYERLQECLWDLYKFPFSEGTLFNVNLACYERLSGYELRVKQLLLGSPLGHFDESGMRVQKQLYWLHVSSTATLTHYEIHEKRGQAAMDAIGILPKFKGRAIHDAWGPYFGFTCKHGLCNAHHLRELAGMEQYEQTWCLRMRACLLDIKRVVEACKAEGLTQLSAEALGIFEKRYDEILASGLKEIPELPPSSKKRGRPKQHPAKNLWDRLQKHKKETLAFMYDFEVPFDNNQGERDIRMVKVKQKVSGCFRSPMGAKIFARVRGYISTARKQSINVLEALEHVIREDPFIPRLIQ